MHLKCIHNPSHPDPSKIHQYLIKPFAPFNQLNQKNSDATSKKYSNNQYSHHEFSICTCSLFVIFLDYNIKINWNEGGASQKGGEEKREILFPTRISRYNSICTLQKSTHHTFNFLREFIQSIRFFFITVEVEITFGVFLSINFFIKKLYADKCTLLRKSFEWW